MKEPKSDNELSNDFWKDYDFIINDYIKRGGSKKDAVQIARDVCKMTYIIKKKKP